MAHSEPSWSNRAAILIAILVLVAFAVIYLPLMNAPFQFDDRAGILGNRALHDLSNLRAWALYNEGMPRPLLNFSFALNYALSGDKPFGYRLSNLFLHIINSALVFLLVRKYLLSQKIVGETSPVTFAAVIGASLFALHPLAGESVLFIWSRSTTLMSTFYLLSINLWLLGTKKGFVAATISFLCALLVKEEAMTLIPVLAVLVWSNWPPGTESDVNGADTRKIGIGKVGLDKKGRIMAIAFLAVPLAGIALWRLKVGASSYDVISWHVRESGDFGNELLAVTPTELVWQTFITQLAVLWRYASLMFWPIGQSVDHAAPLLAGYTEDMRRGVYIIIGLTGLVAFKKTRAATVLPGSLIIFPLAIFFVIPLGDAMVERRTYLPLAGVAMFVALGAVYCLTHWTKEGNQKWFGLIAVVLAICLLALSGSRAQVWKSREALWLSAVHNAPYKLRPRQNLGQVYLENGDLERAEGMMRSIMYRHEYDFRAQTMLAVIALKQNQPRLAMAYARQAIVAHPYGVPEAYYNLGVALDRTGDRVRAIEAYRAALFLQEEYVDAHNNLGALLAESGNVVEGIIHLERSAQLNGGSSRTFVNLANAYAQMGKIEKAFYAAKRAVELEPDSSQAAYALSTAMARRGDMLGAYNEVQRSLQLNPAFWFGYDLMSELLYRQGASPQARENMCAVIQNAIETIEHDDTTPIVIQRARARGCELTGYND